LLSDDVNTLLGMTKGIQWSVPIALAAWTGMRRSEVLALRWSDVDLEARTVAISRTLQTRPKDQGGGVQFGEPKTPRSKRTIRLGPTVITVLKSHKADQARRRLALGSGWLDGDVICDRGDGGTLHPDAMTRAFKRLAKRAGLPPKARLHDLRRAVGNALMVEGVPLKGVSATLGHSSETFTARAYQDVVDELQDQVVDALERRLRGG
jgi:integrase